MNSEEANRLMTSAKKKLTSVGKIFKGRDNGTDFEVLCYEEDGAITAALKLWTTDHPFDPEIDEQLVASNLSLLGGFKDVGVNVTECGKEMTFYATYTGDADLIGQNCNQGLSAPTKPQILPPGAMATARLNRLLMLCNRTPLSASHQNGQKARCRPPGSDRCVCRPPPTKPL